MYNKIMWKKTNKFKSNKYIDYNIDGQFRILHACDLHLSSLTYFLNNKTKNLLLDAVNKYNPDLVVINGDLVWSFFNKQILIRFANLMEKNHIYWAYSFGNHDEEFGYDKYALAKILDKYQYCLFDKGPSNLGCGNYFINLKVNDKIAYTLSFIDTSNNHITKLQTSWYEWNIKNYNKLYNKKIKTITFMHIPLEQLKTIAHQKQYSGTVKKRICPLKYDGGFYEVAKKLNSTKAIFNGHDHVNNFYAMQDNILLMSALSCGYGGFGKKNFRRGFVIIDLDTQKDKMDITTITDKDINKK